MPELFAVQGADVLFAHWPVAPDALRDRLPDGLAVDTYDGDAWVTVLPHRIVGLRLGGGRLPVTFPQLNVRTYVRYGDQQGVFFLGCETGDRLGAIVARRAFGIPFRRAEMSVRESGGRITVRSRRSCPGGDVRLDARYRQAGAASPAESGSLTAFLIERSRWFVADDGLRVGKIEREPWQLAPVEADLRTNTLDAAYDLSLEESPIVHYSPGYDMAVRPLSRVES